MLCNSVFKKKSCLFLLDDFEQNLPNADKGDLTLAPLAQEVLQALLNSLPTTNKKTQLIITCRYQFPMITNHLQPMSPDSFRGPDLQKKIKTLDAINRFSDPAIRQLLITAGRGNPRLLEALDTLIKESPDTDFESLLEKVSHQQEEFVQRLTLQRIIASQPPDFTQFLRHAAVFFAPVPKQGLENVCRHIPNWESHNQKAVQLSLMEATIVANNPKEFWLTPMLRQELFAQLSSEAQLKCHQSAVQYYLPLIEELDDDKPHSSIQLIDHALEADMPDEAVLAGGPLLKFLGEHLAIQPALFYGHAIASVVSEAKKTEKLSLFWTELGLILNQTGHSEEAIDCFSKSLYIDKQIYEEYHPEIATDLNNLGAAYSELGDFQKAIELHDQAFVISRQIYGERHPDVATCLNSLGATYKLFGNYNKAIEFFEKSLAIKKLVYGEGHSELATDFNNLGSAYEAFGDFPKAINNYEKALAIVRDVHGEVHPNVASTLSNLGTSYYSLGVAPKAIIFFENALAIITQIYGEHHPLVATFLNNLGAGYYSLGNFPKAIEFYDRALSIVQALYGEIHPHVASTLNNLGAVNNSIGDYQKAVEYSAKALAIGRQIYGTLNPNVIAFLSNLASAYESLEEYKVAFECVSQMYKIISDFLGPDHPNSQNVQMDLHRLKQRVEMGELLEK